MCRFVIALTLLTQCVGPVFAGTMGFGRFGGGGFGHGPGNVTQGGIFGGGLSGENLQTRFEDRFEELMTDYDTGLMDVEDFFVSDEYSEIVDDLETLVERHDFYVDRIDQSISRFDDIVESTNDRLLYFEDLLVEYQDDDDLSDDSLMRIEGRITRITDRLDLQIENLAKRQTTLNESLPSIIDFNDDLSSYLDDIVTASMPLADEIEDDPLVVLATISAVDSLASSLSLSATAVSVPEPSSRILLAFLVVVGVLQHGVRRQRRPA